MRNHARLPMAGKTVLMGATSGLGKATAVGLAVKGAHVAIVGRDHGGTEAAAHELNAVGAGDVHVFVADVSSQAQVRRLAADALERLPRLDVLINNVGGFWNTRRVTADGIEHTFAINHLAPFLLTNLLLERLQQGGPSRVVNVASHAESMGRIDFRRPPGSALLLRRSGLQPVQARQRPVHLRARQETVATVVTANAVPPRQVKHLVRSRGPRHGPAAGRAVPATDHEDPRPAAPARPSTSPPLPSSSTSRASTSRTASRSDGGNAATTRPRRRSCGGRAPSW